MVYLKLFPGDAAHKLDSVIVALLPELLQLEGSECCFYLRYVDEEGAHLRLRLRPAEGRRDELAAAAQELCDGVLLRLPLLPPSPYRAMVPEDDREARAPARVGRLAGVVTARYEPELDKYGGMAGVRIAEASFGESSRVAVSVLRDEAGGGCSRKTLAPCLMQRCLDAFAPGPGHTGFWRDYSYHWLGGETRVADDWRAWFSSKADRLREEEIPVVAPADALDPAARAILETWEHHLRRVSQAFRRLGEAAAPSPQSLAFHFMHLTNNRLGLAPMEEAYLAVLLERHSEVAACS